MTRDAAPASGLPVGFNKDISNLWLSVTDACNQRCRYCFVRKGQAMMSFDTARAAIDFFLAAPEVHKRIDYYGGEPLLNAALLARSMPYAVKQAQARGLDLRTYMSTNATLYTPAMTFLRDCQVHVLVSIDGDRETHDAVRRFAGGGPTHDTVVAAFRSMQEHLEQERLCALFTVTPQRVAAMAANFQYLTDLGFRSINVEPERCPSWTPEARERFAAELAAVIAQVEASVEGPPERRIFLNFVSHELAGLNGTVDRQRHCPFYRNLIVYPDGVMATPPTIVFEEMRDLFMVGDVTRGLFPTYAACAYDPETSLCRQCHRKGVQVELSRDHGVHHLRNQLLRELTERLVKAASWDPLSADYIRDSQRWTYV